MLQQKLKTVAKKSNQLVWAVLFMCGLSKATGICILSTLDRHLRAPPFFPLSSFVF